MTVTAPTDTRSKLQTALRQVRLSRHHPECRCCLYRSPEVHAGYCSVQEYQASEKVDVLITRALRESF